MLLTPLETDPGRRGTSGIRRPEPAFRKAFSRTVPVAADPATLTIDPGAAAAARTPAVNAVIPCHLHGIPADVPALAAALTGVDVVEDRAKAFDAALDGTPTGCLGDIAIFSAGPGKSLDSGEAGIILARAENLMERIIALSANPVQQLLAGIDDPAAGDFSLRVHPIAAILLWHRLALLPPKPPAAPPYTGPHPPMRPSPAPSNPIRAA